MIKKGSMAEINSKKYLQPPTWEYIKGFLDELGVSANHLERFFQISYNTLTQVKSGTRSLPKQYWHIFYERIKPNYGAGFLHEYTEIGYAKKTELQPKLKKKPGRPKKIIAPSHSRLASIK